MSIKNLLDTEQDAWKRLNVSDVTAKSATIGSLSVTSLSAPSITAPTINCTTLNSTTTNCTTLNASGFVNASNIHVDLGAGNMKIGDGAKMPDALCTVIGNVALDGANTAGTAHTVVGAFAGTDLTGTENVVIGDNALKGTAGAHNSNGCVIIGSNANSGALTGSMGNFVVIGANSSAGSSGVNRIVLGGDCVCSRDNTIAISNPLFNASMEMTPANLAGYYVVEVGPANFGIIPIFPMPPVPP